MILAVRSCRQIARRNYFVMGWS